LSSSQKVSAVRIGNQALTGTVVVVVGGVVVVVVVVGGVVVVVVVVGGVVVVVVVVGGVVVVDGRVVVVAGRVVVVESETTLVVVVGTGVVVVAIVSFVLVEEVATGRGGCEVVVGRTLAARTDTGGVVPPTSDAPASPLSLPNAFTPTTSPPRRSSTKIITSRARRLTISAWP
jgi:hypothetical protein